MSGKTIPKIFQHVWLDKKDHSSSKYPEVYQPYMNLKEKLHPDFQHNIWSYDDVLALVRTELQQYEQLFTTFLTVWICKCDLARLFIVYVHGGIYADLDFYYKKNVWPLIAFQEQYFVSEPVEHTNGYHPSISNGFFATKPKHPFVLDLIKYINDNATTVKYNSPYDVISNTGPTMLYKCYMKTRQTFDLRTPCEVLPTIFTNQYSVDCANVKGQEYAMVEWKNGTEWQREFRFKKKYKQESFSIITGVMLLLLVLTAILVVRYSR